MSKNTQISAEKQKIDSIKSYLNRDDSTDRINSIFGNDEKMIARFKDSLVVQVLKNQKLLNCSLSSIIECAFDIALSGMIPDGRNAHLVPFKDKCTVIIDYRGYVRQILNNPDYVDVRAVIVYSNEQFDMQMGDIVLHRQIIDPEKRGYEIGCYTKVKHISGQCSYEFMNKHEIEEIRDSSMGYTMSKRYNKQSIWDTNPYEMWKKTVIRRHQKRLKLDVDAQHLFNIPDINLYKDTDIKDNSNYGKPDNIPNQESSHLFDMPVDTEEVKNDEK
jgi:recombination protein RecT